MLLLEVQFIRKLKFSNLFFVLHLDTTAFCVALTNLANNSDTLEPAAIAM